MNIQSMTGYGKEEILSDEFFASIELKSVNNRFLDLQFKIPKNLNPIEHKMRAILESHVTRGSITCVVQYTPFHAKTAQLQLQDNLLDDYLRIIRKINDRLNTPDNFDVSGLLRIPELVQVQALDLDLSVLETHILPAYERCCKKLVKMRQEEGTRMVREISGRVSNLMEKLPEVEALIPKRQKEYMEKMQKRTRDLLNGNPVPEDRLLTEIGLMAEKMDITEEVVRFRAHAELFLTTLERDGAPGKKLGFILQEMLRETNTMGAKAQFIDIQHLCVFLKEEIEKVREQSMNLE